MPKLKTHKATAKRFRKTASGRIFRAKVGKSHLRRKKAQRTHFLFGRKLELTGSGEKKHIKRLAPYL